MSSDLKLRGRIFNETDNAIQIGKTPESTELFWIPKSQIGYKKKTPDQDPMRNLPYIEFTLPEWLVEKKQIWDLVE